MKSQGKRPSMFFVKSWITNSKVLRFPKILAILLLISLPAWVPMVGPIPGMEAPIPFEGQPAHFPGLRFLNSEAKAQNPPVCDVDQDGDIDQHDIAEIFGARGMVANPVDPRDANGDGVITINDGRACVLQCTLPRCAIVTRANNPPDAHAGPDQSIFLGDQVTLDGSRSSDVDRDPLTFHWVITTEPSGSSAILSDPMAVRPTFFANASGTYVLELVVNDGLVDSASDVVTITTGNSPPEANAGPDQTVVEGATVDLDGSGSTDVNGDPLTYSWILTSVPAGSTATLSNPDAVLPNFVADVFGTYVAQLMVNDGIFDSAPDTVSITTDNSPPVADAGPDQTVVVGGVVHLDGSSSFDVNGDPLTHSLALLSVPPGSTAVLSDPMAVAPTFVADLPGTYVAQLIVKDGMVSSVPDTIVIDTNDSSPVADAGLNQSVKELESVQLDGSGSHDVDGSPLTFSWALLSVPPGSTAFLSDPVAVAPTFVADLPGTYVAQLIVKDGMLNSSPDTVRIIVEALPKLSITDIALEEGGSGVTTAFTFVVSLSEPGVFDVTVDFDTANDSAEENIDFIPNSGQVTFPAGDNDPRSIIVEVKGDNTVEPDETFFVNLSTPVNALISLGQGQGTIINDDVLPIGLVPDVVGLTRTDAEAAILSANFSVGSVSTAPGGEILPGHVNFQTPLAGTSAFQGSPVDVVIREEVLAEHSNFQTHFALSITVPAEPSTLKITYEDLMFDPGDEAINDAFEIALVDSSNSSLVHPIGPGRDALFNATEDQAILMGVNTRLDGQTVCIDLTHIPPGVAGTLVLRLINNDEDTTTSVKVTSVAMVTGSLGTPKGIAFDPLPSGEDSPIDFSSLSVISQSVKAQYGLTSLVRKNRAYFSDLRLLNTGTFSVNSPLLVVIDQISDPSVRVNNPDGVTPEGLPFYKVSRFQIDDGILSPGELTQTRSISFLNPNLQQFSYELIVLGRVNSAPQITSQPRVEALVDKPYQYAVQAIDNENDGLSYALRSNPTGMTIDPSSGLIQWTPAVADLGNHSIHVRVTDSHGAQGDQVYTLAVRQNVPNRPPTFVSTPVVDTNVQKAYGYQATADDPDGDGLTFSLVSGPVGLQVSASGQVTWTPTANQIGPQSVVIEVSDGQQGGVTQQVFTVLVQQEEGNRSPLFVSLPPTLHNLPRLPNAPQGNVTPIAIDLSLLPNEVSIQNISVTPSTDPNESAFADVIITVDQSGSMAGEIEWISQMVLDLENALLAKGIGPNRFALGGYVPSPGDVSRMFSLAQEAHYDLEVYGPDNQLIDTSDHATEAGMPILQLQAPVDGAYTLLLRPKASTSTLDFNLDVIEKPLPLPVAPTGIGVIHSGTIVGFGTTVFTFGAPAGTFIYLDWLGEPFTSIAATITDPLGALLVTVNGLNNEIGPIALPISGTYLVTLRGTNSLQTRDFKVRMIDANANVLAFDTVIAGALDVDGAGMETDLFAFDGLAGQRLFFDAQGADRNGDWKLIGPSGEVLNGTGTVIDRNFDLRLDQDGPHFLALIGDDDSAPVNYQFQAVLSNPAPPPPSFGSEGIEENGGLGQQADDPTNLGNVGNEPSGSLGQQAANPLTLGNVVNGTISKLGQRDIYTFSGIAGQQVYYDGLAADSIFIDASLTSPTGKTIFPALNADIDSGLRVLTETGEYRLTITGVDETLGAYSFRLLDAANAGTLIHDTVINATVAPRHTELFHVSGTAGERLYFDRIASGVGIRWFLFSPHGSLVASSFNFSDMEHLPTVGGDFLLVIESTTSAGSVDYTVQILTPPTTTQGIVYGSTIANTFTEPGERRMYPFPVSVGDRIFYDGIQRDSTQMQASLVSPTGELLFANLSLTDDQGPFVALEAGTYQLIVNARDSIGNFSFRVLNGLDASVLALGVQITGNLNPGVTELHQINGMAGQRLQFDRLSGGSGGTWRLFQPDGTLAFNRGLSNDFERDIEEDGAHLLAVQSGGSSVDFDFQVNDISDAPVAPSGFGILQAGTLAPLEVREFNFDAPAGTLLYLDILTLSGIRITGLRPSGSQFFAHANFFDAGPFYLAESGSYTLSVQNNSGVNSNDFSFRLLSGAETSPLPFDARMTGSLNPGKTSELFAFTGTVGQRLLFNHLSVGDNGVWNLFDPNGTKLNGFNFPLQNDFVFTPETAGLHTLVLEGRDETNPVNYDFEVVRSPVSTLGIALGDRIEASLTEAGEVDFYTFQAVAGQVIYYDGFLEPSTLGRVTLTGPEGDILFVNQRIDANVGPMTLDRGGRYTIKILALDGTVGDYGFQILDVEAAALVLGGNLNGTLDPGESSSLFSFAGNAGDRIFLNSLAGSATGSFRIFGPDGISIASGRFDRDVEAVLKQGGVHVLVLEGNNAASPVAFDFDALAPVTVTTPLLFGVKIDESISVPGEQDVYTFQGTAGQRLFFNGLFNDPNIQMDLFTPSGEDFFPFLTRPSERKGPFTLTEDGTYTLVVDGAGDLDATGAYRFIVLNLGTAPPVTAASNLIGTFSDVEDAQIFSVNATAGQLIRVGNSDAFFGTAEQISDLATTIFADRFGGGQEDGYAAIRTAMRLEFRPGASSNIILVSDEDRDATIRELTFGSTLTALQAHDILLNVVVNADLEDGTGTDALSIDSQDTAFLPDGAGGFTTSPGATVKSAFGTTERDYIDLALASGGAAHDLNQLRAGGLLAQSFTAAFVEVKGEEILSQVGLDVIASDPDVLLTNLTGILPGIGGDDTGNFQVQFTGDGSAHSFDLLFIRPNTGQIVGSIPVTMNSDYVYLASAVDSDADSLTYSLPIAPVGATIDPGTGQVKFSPVGEGSFLFTVEVIDGRGGKDIQSFTLNVTAGGPNIDPTISSTPVTKGIVGRAYQYIVGAGDADTDPLLFFLNSSPQGMGIDLRSGRITWTPLPVQQGDHPVEVLVLDGHGGKATQSFIVTVGPDLSNTPPVFESSPITDAVPGELYQYKALASDADGDALVFDLPLKPAGMTVDPVTGAVAWRPNADQAGVHTVVLRVNDGNGGITLQSYDLNVIGPNSPPVILSTPGLDAGVGLPYVYQVRANDAEDDTLSFGLLTAPAGMAIDAASGLITWTPGVSDVGSQMVKIEVSDGRGGVAMQTFDLAVTQDPDNDAPTITSVPRDNVALGRTWNYRLAANDPNNDPLTFNLEVAPAGMAFDPNTGLITWTPVNTQFGDNPVRLRVSDGRGGEAVQDFIVEVRSSQFNTPPVILSGPSTTATVNLLYQYRPVAEDADRDPISFDLVEAPQGMSIDPISGDLRWTPALSQTGPHNVILRAFDAQGGEATQQFAIQVNGTNQSPTVISVPPTVAAVGQSYTYDVEATDPESQPFTFSLNAGPLNMTINAVTGLVQWTPSGDQAGDHQVEVQVADTSGGLATQVYTVQVGVTAINDPALITTTPVFAAHVGDPYVYDVDATDPEGDILAFSLEQQPVGMTIDPSTGLIQWTPIEGQVGVHPVRVHVEDTAGNISFQAYSVTVVQDNQPPQITSAPLGVASAGRLYSYDVQANDPDGDPLQFSLSASPAGMTIDSQGRVRWTPQIADIGPHPVEITVTDPLGAVATQTFDLPVVADARAPVVSLTLSGNPIALNTSATLTVLATDDVRVETLDVTFDGVPLSLDGNGQTTLAPTTLGNFEIVATATDNAGNVTVVRESLTVNESGTPGAPFVFIKTPLPGTTIQALTDVIGTVNDDNLAFYSLSIAPLQGGDFQEIARGTSPVIDNLLGKFDPTLLANGGYRLRLTAQDTGLLISSDEIIVDVAGNLKLGNYTLSFVDLSMPLSGIPIELVRNYDTLQADRASEVGFGWRLELQDFRVATNLPDPSQEGDLIFKAFRPGTKVYLTRPGGVREGFTFQAVPFCKLCGLLSILKPTFVPDPGVTSTLTVDQAQLRFNDFLGEYQSYVGSLPYNPASPAFGGTYILTTKEDSLSYEIDAASGRTLSVSNLNGVTVTYENNGIVSSFGQRIDFERDVQGRVTAVIDPSGHRIVYTYDTNGDLTSVKDREGHLTRFTYNVDRPHFLEEVIDPLGRTGARSEYNEDGRLVRLIDTAGGVSAISYDPDNSLVTITDKLGNDTIVEYDPRGNVISRTNALGGTTTFTYDANDNQLTETDPLGRMFSRTYDANGNVLSRIDFEGNAAFFTVNSRGKPLSITDDQGNTAVNTYDTRNNLIKEIDANGNLVQNAYDSVGNLLTITDPEGNVFEYIYDAKGNPIQSINQLGQVTTSEYGANNILLSNTTTRTLADGSIVDIVTHLEYNDNDSITGIAGATGIESKFAINEFDLVTAVSDQTNRVVSYEYDEMKKLTGVAYPDGSREEFTYDAEGHRLSHTNRDGHTTRFEYDVLGRLIKTINPDGTFNTTTYDAVGRVLTTTDELGRATSHEYANHLETITDPLGNVTVREFNSDGPPVLIGSTGDVSRITDAAGNTTTFDYDRNSNKHGLGSETVTTFADGSTIKSLYDGIGRVVSRIDQAGHATGFVNDADGNLVSVIEPPGGQSTYVHNEVRDVVSISDANGKATRFEHNKHNLLTKHVLPLGQQKTFVYDVRGNLVTQTDFNGNTTMFEYDVNNRLTKKTFQDGSVEMFAYTPEGLRTQAGGDTYAYNNRGWLNTETKANGEVLTYTYDAVGNRISIATPQGTTGYTYDAVNRLETVEDPNGGITTYTYNPVGMRTTETLPNGIVATYTYDDLNRISFIETRNVGGALLSSFSYTRGLAGHILQVAENDGRIVDYTYDELFRLTGENISDPGAGARILTYTYDAVGNRLSKNDSIDGETIYAYDDNNRLVSENTPGGIVFYTYDDNGNLLTKNGLGSNITYAYDFEDQLIRVNNAGQVTEYAYDADGIRRSSVTNGTEVINFLVDKNRRFAQVLAETDGSGATTASYVYGIDLISMARPESGTSYYTYDGQLSARQLADVSGAVTDTYTYDAFGELTQSTGSTTNSYRFAGEQFDGNADLYYLRARYNDTSTGRFNTTDPFPGILTNPISLHRYLYAANDPVNKFDPSGEFTLLSVLAATAFSSNLDRILLSATSTLLHRVENNYALQFAKKMALQHHAGLYTLHYRNFYGLSDFDREEKVRSTWLETVDLAFGKVGFKDGGDLCNAKTFAYVYPGDGGVLIYVCSLFYKQPIYGTYDSRAGSVIHEISHETGLTLDFAYGLNNVLNLAKSSPDTAITNADTYQFQAEYHNK